MGVMGKVVLQNCIDLEKAVPVLWRETCLVLLYYVNYFIILKLNKCNNISPPPSGSKGGLNMKPGRST
jgi:hypothetical protein